MEIINGARFEMNFRRTIKLICTVSALFIFVSGAAADERGFMIAGYSGYGAISPTLDVHYRHWRHRHGIWRHHHRGCSLQNALRTASRYGLRHAYVRNVGPYAIHVEGWFRGHRAFLFFARHSSKCVIVRAGGI